MTDPLPAVSPFVILLFSGSKQSVIDLNGETMCARPGQQNGYWFGIDRELRPIRRYSWTLLLSSANQPKHKNWCFWALSQNEEKRTDLLSLEPKRRCCATSKMPSHRSHGWNIVPWRASTLSHVLKKKSHDAKKWEIEFKDTRWGVDLQCFCRQRQ